MANVDRHFRFLSRSGHFPLAKRKYPVLRARDLNLTNKCLRRIGAQHEIDFDVWALSCIGAWVGIVYHRAFAPDWGCIMRALGDL